MQVIPFLIPQTEVAKLDKVTSPDIVLKKISNTEYTMDNYGYAWRFHPEGLFSENIFGCVLDYTCACPKTWTAEQALKQKYCPNCGAKLTLSKARRMITAAIELPIAIINPLIALQAKKSIDLIDNKHFVILTYESRTYRSEHKPNKAKLVTGPELTHHVKYDVPLKVVHPVIIWLLAKYLYIQNPKLLNHLMNIAPEQLVNLLHNTDTKHKSDKDFTITINNETFSIPSYESIKGLIPAYARSVVLFRKEYLSDYEILYLLKYLTQYQSTLSSTAHQKLLSYLNLPDTFAIYRYIEVLPPDYRSIVFDGKVYHVATELVNTELWPILRLNKAREIEPIYPDNPFDYYDSYIEYVTHIHKYYTILMDKIIKKNQIIRGHKLGKRIDLSARAVLVGNPALKPNEVILPYLFGLMLYYPYILRRYAEHKNIDYSTADEELQDMIERRDISDTVKQILDQFLEDNREAMLVILMRQPVLHIPNTTVFQIRAWSDDVVVQTNQVWWSMMNADCDGDSVCGHLKLTIINKRTRERDTITIDLTRA